MAIIWEEDRNLQGSPQSNASQNAQVQRSQYTQSELPFKNSGSDGLDEESTSNAMQCWETEVTQRC